YAIRHLGEVSGVSSSDVLFNGIKGDLKSLSSHNNIIRHAKNAINEQGADIVIFEFSNKTSLIIDKIRELSRKRIHGYYYFSTKPTKILKF
ncbi:MAG: hypothetical protein RSA66_09335, partial [Muribaculaceae bacterium]